MRRRQWLARLSVAALLPALPACRGTDTGSGEAVPPRPAMVTVSASEYRFQNQPSIPAGRAVFRARNAGREEHQVILVRLPDELRGSFDQQLRSGTRRTVETVFQLPLPAGDATAFAADLGTGRYGFACFARDADGTLHALKGMSSELRVTDQGGVEATHEDAELRPPRTVRS